MLCYPIDIKRSADGACLVSFPDLPEVKTSAPSDAGALRAARKALENTLAIYWAARRLVPMPGGLKRGQGAVELPTSLAAKVLLRNELIRQGLRQSQFARLMRRTPQYVDRLTDIRHINRIDSLTDAFLFLGKRLDLRLVASTAPVPRNRLTVQELLRGVTRRGAKAMLDKTAPARTGKAAGREIS